MGLDGDPGESLHPPLAVFFLFKSRKIVFGLPASLLYTSHEKLGFIYSPNG